MKTKNNLTTGILLGIGMIVIPLIIMGNTYTTEKQNTWEIHMDPTSNDTQGFLLNTETGATFYLHDGKKIKSIFKG